MNITECCDKGYFLFSQKFILHFCLGKFHIGIIITVNITVTYVHVDSAEFFFVFLFRHYAHIFLWILSAQIRVTIEYGGKSIASSYLIL